MSNECYSDGENVPFLGNLYTFYARKRIPKCPCGLKQCKMLRERFEKVQDTKRNKSIQVKKICLTEPDNIIDTKKLFRSCICDILNTKKSDNQDITIEAWHFHPEVLRSEDDLPPYSYISQESKATEIYQSTNDFQRCKVPDNVAMSGSWFVLPNYPFEKALSDVEALESAVALNTTMNPNDKDEDENEFESNDLAIVSSGSSGATLSTEFQDARTPVQEDIDINTSSLQDVLKELLKKNNTNQQRFESRDPLALYTTKTKKSLFRNVSIGMIEACSSVLMPNVPTRDQRMAILATVISENLHGPKHSIYTKTGETVFKVLQEKDKPKDRRQFMSMVCDDSIKRLDVARIFGGDGSKVPSMREWREARKHRLYPGIGAPCDRIHPIFRKKCNEAMIDNFLAYCATNDMFQNVAFGHKICKYQNGKHVAIPSVKTTNTVRHTIRAFYADYLKTLEGIYDKNGDNDQDANIDEDDGDGDAIPDDKDVDNDDGWYIVEDEDTDDIAGPFADDDNNECRDDEDYQLVSRREKSTDREDGRCPCVCRKSKLRCQKRVNHTGNHRFTPNGYPSPTVIERLLSKITDGTIKSLAGLDNTHVIKGHDNFIMMRGIVDSLYDVSGLKSVADMKDKDDLIQAINEVDRYHQRDFADHLKTNLRDEPGSPCCTCVKCGMHHAKYPVTCPCRDKPEGKGGHSKPCKDCQKTFEVIMELYDLHAKARNIVLNDKSRKDNQVLIDDIDSWKLDIDSAQENLREFRAHICQKEDEAIYETNSYRNLQKGEAVVVCDYKMKILPAQFREPQKHYFGKRGFSCLGFMVLLPSDGENEVNVEYHFMLSKDTTQDAHAVACAKEAFYTILKKRGIDIVHFRADGAGCFKGNLSKAMCIHWKDMLGIVEKTYKISVAGCGKSNLDGMFGIITMHLQRLVNAGHDYLTAEDCYNLLAKYPLQSSYFHLFEPDRSFEFKTEATNLADYFLLECIESDSPDEDSYILARIHSRHGDGVIYKKKQLRILRKACKGEDEDETDGCEQLACRVEEEAITSMVPLAVDTNTSAATVVSPLHEDDIMTRQFNFPSPSNKHRDSSGGGTDVTFHPYILKSTWNNEVSNNDNQSKFSLESNQARKHKNIQDRIGKANEKFATAIEDKRSKLVDSGLFCCDAKDEHGQYCTAKYISKKCIERHRRKNVHVFPKTSSMTSVIDRAAAGVVWSLGLSRSNIDGENAEIMNLSNMVASKLVLDSEGIEMKEHVSVSKTWFEPGCYNKLQIKSGRERAKNLSTAAKLDLEQMFCLGESSDNGAKPNSSKYTAEEAFARLSNMVEGGRRKYSATSENGPVPSIARIRTWFSGRARGTIQPFVFDGNPYNDKSKKQLVNLCEDRGLPTKGKTVLLRLLFMNDTLNGLSSTLADYNSKSVSALGIVCEDRGLPNKPANVAALKKLLQLYDEIQQRNETRSKETL